MEKCLYNNRILYARQVGKDILLEKKVRTQEDYQCLCPDCHCLVYYKNGKIKNAHFAHAVNNGVCEYQLWEREARLHTTNGNKFKELLTNSLIKKYSNIELDYKLEQHLWVHYFIPQSRIAIDVTDITISAEKIDKKYKKIKSFDCQYIKFILTQPYLIKNIFSLSYQEKFELFRDRNILYAVNQDNFEIMLIGYNEYINRLYFKKIALDEIDFISFAHEKELLDNILMKSSQDDIEDISKLQNENIEQGNDNSSNNRINNLISNDIDKHLAKQNFTSRSDNGDIFYDKFDFYMKSLNLKEDDITKNGVISPFSFQKIILRHSYPDNLESIKFLAKFFNIDLYDLVTENEIKREFCADCGKLKIDKEKNLCISCIRNQAKNNNRKCLGCNKPIENLPLNYKYCRDCYYKYLKK